jgi:hypothetical protein
VLRIKYAAHVSSKGQAWANYTSALPASKQSPQLSPAGGQQAKAGAPDTKE